MLNKNQFKRTLRSALTLLGAAILSATASAQQSPSVVDEFAQLLLGTFDSSTQAIDDSDYLDVTVQHCTVQVKELPAQVASGRFLALRQSVSTSADPYRVRILRVFGSSEKDAVSTSSFAPRPGVDFSDLCLKPESERVVSFADLSEERCTTTAKKDADGSFVGGTTGEGCPSTRMGSVRMTSEVRLNNLGMSTWDRGWDAQGNLAWGPAKGPYRFERVKAQDVRLAQLSAFFAGKFSNAEQVAADPKNFTPVEYEFCQIDFADEPLRPGTRLMLAQQTVTTPARVFKRNRIYEFFRNEDGKIAVRTNPFNETSVPQDICSRPLEERRALPKDILTQRDSCVLTFDWNEVEQSFVGGTAAEGCASNFQGAVKMTIEEIIKDGLIQPWERWFNAQGEQVAGSKVGPYIYKRK
ncbi:MAG: hypothetical protein RI932_1180 [Pseudomonadota bacterium]|jgi:hypothetical protein